VVLPVHASARQQHSSAEEPVIARIRRPTLHSSKPATQPVAALRAVAAVQQAPQFSTRKPPMTFQQRIKLERQSKDRDPA